MKKDSLKLVTYSCVCGLKLRDLQPNMKKRYAIMVRFESEFTRDDEKKKRGTKVKTNNEENEIGRSQTRYHFNREQRKEDLLKSVTSSCQETSKNERNHHGENRTRIHSEEGPK